MVNPTPPTNARLCPKTGLKPPMTQHHFGFSQNRSKHTHRFNGSKHLFSRYPLIEGYSPQIKELIWSITWC
jgi:hypothetical protein